MLSYQILFILLIYRSEPFFRREILANGILTNIKKVILHYCRDLIAAFGILPRNDYWAKNWIASLIKSLTSKLTAAESYISYWITISFRKNIILLWTTIASTYEL